MVFNYIQIVNRICSLYLRKAFLHVTKLCDPPLSTHDMNPKLQYDVTSIY